MSSKVSSKPLRIGLVYTIYFLYYEPLAALGGFLIAFANPARLIRGLTPLTVLPSTYHNNLAPPVEPLMEMLIRNLGSMYALFAIQEGIILRLSKERSVWFATLGAFCLTDICHLYATYSVDPQRFTDVMAWNSDEWINYGTLSLGLAIRIAFMLGYGRN